MNVAGLAVAPRPPPRTTTSELRLRRRAYGMGLGRFEMTPLRRPRGDGPDRTRAPSAPWPRSPSPPPAVGMGQRPARLLPLCVWWTLCVLAVAATASVLAGWHIFCAERGRDDSWSRRSWVAGRSLLGASLVGPAVLAMATFLWAEQGGRSILRFAEGVDEGEGPRPLRHVRRWTPPAPSI